MEEHEKNGWEIDHWSKSVGKYDGRVFKSGAWEVTTDVWEGGSTFVTEPVAQGTRISVDNALNAADKALEEAVKQDEPKTPEETTDDLEEDVEELREKIERLEAEIEELKKRRGAGYVPYVPGFPGPCSPRMPWQEQVWCWPVPFGPRLFDTLVWGNFRR